MRITIRKEDYEQICRSAAAGRPEEVCGLLAGIDREDGVREIRKIYLLTNTDHSPEHFSIDPKEQVAAVRDMRACGLAPLGNWHSHPETAVRPSAEDIRLANDSSASYLIVSLAEEGEPVLNGYHIRKSEEGTFVRQEEMVIV